MELTIAEVEHIAALARLELSAEEKERFRVQLSAILGYAARLQALDTSGIPLTLPATAASADTGGLREDEPRAGLPLDDVLRNAPDSKDRQFRVPPVLE